MRRCRGEPRSGIPQPGVYVTDRLALALVALHESPGHAWPLTAMAREAHTPHSAFAARFEEIVGRTPADYVADWRLMVAQDRLRAGASVAVTAAELGHANPSGFSRVFSQRLGRSPRWRLATVQ